MPDLAEEFNAEQALTEGLVLCEGPVASGRIQTGKSGPIAEDGTMKVSVIRPCVSRGKRLKGLPPIYTPSMLSENASVFSGWLMYMDHLTEKIREMLEERGRSISELGGRLLKSWYDPELVFEDDAEFGYQRGGVVAQVVPQPAIKAMVEADPGLLHVSINAWPKGAKPGVAPWSPGVRGMLVEGIVARPPGSVDWVPRGGAGGRVLMEWEDATVSILESHYAAPRGRTTHMPEFKTMTRAALTESLRAENPGLAAELGLAEGATPPAPAPTVPAAPGITPEQLQEALRAQAAEFEAKLAAKDAVLEAATDDKLEERETARALAEHAATMVRDAKLGDGWTTDLLRRWAVGPDGPSAAISRVMEEDDHLAALEEAVKADLKHAGDLIEEAKGPARPRVTGLGGGGSLQEGAGSSAPSDSTFRDFLRESGDTFGDKPEDFDKGLTEMVREGVA